MEISLEVIILVFSTLSIILGGFVTLYLKLGAIQVSIAELTIKNETACAEVDEIKDSQDNHEKRLTTLETEHRTFSPLHN